MDALGDGKKRRMTSSTILPTAHPPPRHETGQAPASQPEGVLSCSLDICGRSFLLRTPNPISEGVRRELRHRTKRACQTVPNPRTHNLWWARFSTGHFTPSHFGTGSQREKQKHKKKHSQSLANCAERLLMVCKVSSKCSLCSASCRGKTHASVTNPYILGGLDLVKSGTLDSRALGLRIS